MKKRKSKESRDLSKLIICITGFTAMEEQEVSEKIIELKGEYEENLTLSVNYLISGKINTEKTQIALQRKIPVVTKDWIMDPSSPSYLNDKKCFIQCFHGLKFSIIGFDQELSAVMKQSIRNRNGRICKYCKSADIIILKSGTFLKDSLKDELKHKSVVTEKWLDECINNNKWINTDLPEYKIDTDFIFSRFEKLFKNFPEDEYAKDSNELFFDKLLFLGKVFYITPGFDKDSRKNLIFAISLCNGIVYNAITPRTNFIIATSDSDIKSEELSYCAQWSKPKIVKYDWIFDSIENKKLADPSEYKPSQMVLFSGAPMSEDDDEEYEDIDVVIIKNEKKGKNKRPIVSNIFIGQSFTIMENGFSKETFKELTEIILENNGRLIQPKNEDQMKGLKGMYIVVNDGENELFNRLNKYVAEEKLRDIEHHIVSHRFVYSCIEKKELVETYDIVCNPFTHRPPYKSLVENNVEIYFPPNVYHMWELKGNENVMEILGAKIGPSKETTVAIVRGDITKEVYKKIVSRTHKGVKIVNEDWAVELIIQGTVPPMENYEVKIVK